MLSTGAVRLAIVSATLALSSLVAGAAPLPADAAQRAGGTQPQLSTPSPVWQALVERVLRGLRPTMLEQLRVGAPPSGQGRQSATGTPTVTRPVWLYVSLRPRRDGDSPLRGEWEANLVAGALRDLAASRGQAPLTGVTVWRAPGAPSGSCCSREERRLDGYASATSLGRPLVPPARDKLRKQVERLGVELASLTVRRPLGLAVEAQITTRP